MEIPCFLTTEKCKNFLIRQVIHRLIGLTIFFVIAVYFQFVTIEYLITHKFFIFFIVLGGALVGHTINCYLEKRKRKI
ncbi:MAG: hypothetical protein WCD44_01210 [Candidatus Babeliales bacterium]